MFQRLAVPALLLLLFSLELHAQSVGAENIRIGSSRDSVLALLRGTYTTGDTAQFSVDSGWAEITMLAPVPLGGLDGLLVLQVDSSGSISEYKWGRAPASMLPHYGVWENYTGWKEWQTPSREEAARVTAVLVDQYFPTDGITMTGPSRSKSRKSPSPDGSQQEMTMQWEHKGTWIRIEQKDGVLVVIVNRWGFDVKDR
jgi:hypothetical protein